ncbi:MAG: radical SAM protein [Planctomycetes bacterium]|nr:radical SAM protein [Planctomycetota bacterium]
MNVSSGILLQTTHSLCPDCRRLVAADIVNIDGRVFLRKQCPEHGVREDFIWADANDYKLDDSTRAPKLPKLFATEATEQGCPFDCGMCPDHRQHTCIGLAEITSGCNLECPLCYAESGPNGKHWSYETFVNVVDRFVKQEGEPDVLQISGGEPTIHPELVRMARYAYSTPIQVIMINTNGVRFAKDEALLEQLATMRDRLEIYLQFEGLKDSAYETLRGEPLLEKKLRAIENLEKYQIRSTLVCSVERGVNDHELGDILQFAIGKKWIRGISFQPATYVGRHDKPTDLDRRITPPDIMKALETQGGGILTSDDFLPLPCAHPNCHRISYLYRHGGGVTPVSRIIDFRKSLDLAADTIVYTPKKARALIERVVGGGGACCGPGESCGPSDSFGHHRTDFVAAALAEKLTGADVFRITITTFLDKYNFDVRRVQRCCIGFLLPSGHTVPFCAYNTLYRDGFTPLPPLR